MAVTPFDEAGDVFIASDVAVEAVDKVDVTVRDENCPNENTTLVLLRRSVALK